MEKARELINGKSRIVGTFEVNWNTSGEDKPAKVKIKKLNFGEYNEVQKACMKITMFGGNPKLDLDQVVMNEQVILRSVIEAPWQINDINALKDLDREIAEIVLTNINELNMPSEKKIS